MQVLLGPRHDEQRISVAMNNQYKYLQPNWILIWLEASVLKYKNIQYEFELLNIVWYYLL